MFMITALRWRPRGLQGLTYRSPTREGASRPRFPRACPVIRRPARRTTRAAGWQKASAVTHHARRRRQGSKPHVCANSRPSKRWQEKKKKPYIYIYIYIYNDIVAGISIYPQLLSDVSKDISYVSRYIPMLVFGHNQI